MATSEQEKSTKLKIAVLSYTEAITCEFEQLILNQFRVIFGNSRRAIPSSILHSMSGDLINR